MTWAALATVLLGSGICMPTAHAQSADALLDKLVEKGVISVKEANELREQSDENFNKALQTKTGLPDWVNQLKIYGDVRGRVEAFRFENDAPNPAGGSEPNKDRTRFRYRLRAGATVTMKDDFELGFRLTSSEATGSFGGDPISGNTTMGDNGSKKNIYVDLAYGKWSPLHHGAWTGSATVGKMENPFVVSDSVFDGDYTPEGGALQSGFAINDSHSLKLATAVFILDEIAQGSQASNDPILYGAQLRYDAKWTPRIATTLGAGWFGLSEEENLGNGAVPNVNVGNTRDAAGNLVYNYAPVVVDAAVTYTLDKVPFYNGAFPIRLAAEYMNNTGADDENIAYWGGIFFGKSGKKKTWELSYRYKYQESDSWYEEFTDSDFGSYYQTGTISSAVAGQGAGYRSGPGSHGHVIKASYSLSDSFTVGLTYFLTDLVNDRPVTAGGQEFEESGTHRVQLDAVWKF
jgi:hypothetical protein